MNSVVRFDRIHGNCREPTSKNLHNRPHRVGGAIYFLRRFPNMAIRTRNALALLATIGASSLLGLARPMWELGADTFRGVWSANLWGDVVFVLATAFAAWGIWRFVQLCSGQPIMTALPAVACLAFFATWATYALSWGFTVQSFADQAKHPFTSLGFEFSGSPEAPFDSNVVTFTLQWGWVGLVAAAIAGPAVVLWLRNQVTEVPVVQPADT